MPRKSRLIFLALFALCRIHIGTTFSSSAADDFNPYKALGLGNDASQGEIKRAYKRLVMEWHPDRNKSPEAEERFLEVNRAYKLLSSAEKREAYDKFGFMDEDFADWSSQERQFFQREQQHFQQYIRWPPPPRRQQNDLKNFILPFASVLGTLFFIFLIGFLLNQMNAAASEGNKRRRQHRGAAANDQSSGATASNGANKDQEWHPEDPKTPLTEEEKQQRVQMRVWRTMGPLIRELRAETQFGLIRLLKPGCRSIIMLVDKDSKDALLPQFARYTYCLRNNKTFSFGFLMVPKNLNWFRSLLELTLPGDEGDEQKEHDSASLQTATTDTNSEKGQQEKEPEEKGGGPILGKFVPAGGAKEGEEGKATSSRMTAKNRLKNINPKHTVGTILAICGWKLYFSIYHPMHRPPSLRNRIGQLESLGEDEQQQQGEGEGECCEEEVEEEEGKRRRSVQPKEARVNVENVLNGFPTFLERLLEGTVRRYYIPEWPDNLV